MKFNKAAMFGLDARIALAIFGALSVISGAALYSAIQQAKVVSFVAQMEEFAKAYTQYYLDTGLDMPTYSVNPDFLVSNRAIENLDSNTDWKGPYWPAGYGNYDNTDGLGRVGFPGYQGAGYVQATNGAWGDFAGAPGIVDCTAGDCSVWAYVELRDVSIEFAKLVNNYIDNDDNATIGRVRVRYFGDDDYNLYYLVQKK
tara:strand:- start:5346 stop:5945 length:600 start_codon:yes stop_codon:yes gene_type:complete